MLALLLGALFLFVPAPAAAQNTPVWSATLTPAAFTTGVGGVGCVTEDQCDTQLSDNSFTVGGKNYSFRTIADFNLAGSNIYSLQASLSDSPNAALQALKFCVGTTEYVIGGSPNIISTTEQGWTAGTPVSLSLGTSCATQSTDATLSALTASRSTSMGGTFSSLTLSPNFASGTTAYTATVANSITHVKLTPTVTDSDATVKVGKQGTTLATVSSSSASGAIALSVGANAISVEVTAEDGTTTQTYTVTVTRQTTVSLSASPNPVREGSSVTVTATLSSALSSPVTIPLSVSTSSPNTAEPGDVGTPTSITIASGQTTGTGTITTNQDGDEDDETFTVSLGSLPSSVAAGSPNSVQVTISDDDKSHTLSVSATSRTPPCGTTVTDMSVKVTYRLSLTPAPAAGEEEATQYAIVNAVGTLLNAWAGASPIRDTGRAPMTDNNTFAEYRAAFPTFAGFKFRLTDTPGVTAQCLWSFPATSQTPGGGRTDGIDTGGGGGSGGGGGGSGGGGGGGSGGGTPPSSEDSPLPEEPQDPEQSDDCGDDDRENLVRFYKSTGGEDWNNNTNWNSEQPLDQWYGVDTDDEENVVSLRLADNGLSGEMPEEELLCLYHSELKELALWDNELSGEEPEELVPALERAVLRDIAEKIDLEPGWFEDYGDPFSFEEWYEGVVMTDEEDGRVRELDFTEEGIEGVIPGSVFELEELKKISIGCGVTLEAPEPEGEREVEVMIMPADDCPEETAPEDMEDAVPGGGGCALGQGGSPVSGFGLFLATLLVFAALVRGRVLRLRISRSPAF